jgi:penicillin G amidase
LNPAQGWLATTNNQPAPPGWPIEIPGNYDLFRIARVEAWMARRERFDRSDMEAMQRDPISAGALARRDLVAEGAERLGRSGLADSLRAWDGSMAKDDALASLFAYWWRGMARHLFEDELGAAWPRAAVLRELVLAEAAHGSTREPAEGTDALALADVSARALSDALELWEERPLGEVQTLTIRHPLSRAPLLDRWLGLDRGPFPRGGSSESLNLAGSVYRLDTDRFDVQIGPSMRYVLDWTDVDGFTIEIPMGQSGNPFSPHYDDFLELNLRGERWVVPFSREAADGRTVRRLRLEPG